MQDTFQWTDDLAFEFASRYPLLTVANKKAIIEAFKANNSPKKEWEVVAYRVRDKSVYYPEYTDDIGRIWGNAEWKGAFIDSTDVNHPDVKIFSVRRLSDGEVFTKNEVVETPKDGQHHIGGFEIVGNDIVANFSTGKLLLKHLQKLPQPILTTADGVEVTDFNNFFPTVLFEDGSMNVNCERNTWENDFAKANGKLFSTREAAEEYILNNRPLLSLNDVKEKLSEWVAPGLVKFVIGSLTALVKQKLNQ